MSERKLTILEQKALGAWACVAPGWGIPFDIVSSYSGVPRDKIRRAVRSLARKGYLRLGAVFNQDDGKIAGRCYMTTEQGDRWIVELKGWIESQTLITQRDKDGQP